MRADDMNCIYILTSEKGSASNICSLLMAELTAAGLEHKLCSAAMCKKLLEPPTALVIPADPSTQPELDLLCANIPAELLERCPIFTLIDSVSYKKLPSVLKWKTIVDISKLPDFIGKLRTFFPKEELSADCISIGGKSVKKSCRLLDLSNSGLSSITELSELSGLRGAFLQQNEISDVSALRRLSELRMLFLYSNRISDITPLGSHKELGILYLFSNQIEDIAPLRALPEIFDLRLSHNNITDISAVSGMKKLQTLHLSGNRIGTVAPLAKLSGLRELQAADCGLERIDILSNLKRLEVLDLSDNQITDISCLFGLEALGELKLYGNPIPRSQIDFLKEAMPLCEIFY